MNRLKEEWRVGPRSTEKPVNGPPRRPYRKRSRTAAARRSRHVAGSPAVDRWAETCS